MLDFADSPAPSSVQDGPVVEEKTEAVAEKKAPVAAPPKEDVNEKIQKLVQAENAVRMQAQGLWFNLS